MKAQSWLLMLILSVGCAKKDKGSNDDSAANNPSQNEDPNADDPSGPGSLALVTLGVSAVNSLDITHSQPVGADAATPGSLAVGASLSLSDQGSSLPSDLPAVTTELDAITSGPAQGLKVKIKKISFRGDAAEVTVFEHAEGGEIEITGAVVDLSALIAKVGKGEGNSLELGVTPGTYNRVFVEYFKQGEIKGCVKGNFDDRGSRSGKTEYVGEHNYCTKSAKSLYAGSKTYNSDFESGLEVTEGEWMQIHLGQPSESLVFPPPAATETFTVEYGLKDSFVAEKDRPIDLTLLIDMNRLLRYANGGRDIPASYSVNVNSTKNPGYFFDSTFKSVSFVFAGKPGKIYGYDILSLVCPDASLDLTDRANPTCSDQGGFYGVDTWMTLVMDPQGKPLTMFIQPSDDTRLTTLVGSHYRDGSPWIFAGTDNDHVDIRYNNDSPGNSYFRGTIADFPADLDATPAATDRSATPFMLFWDLHDENDVGRDAKKIYPDSAEKYPPNKDQSGVAYFWRRL